jgi:phage shock protein PspC (stress-responsive transcriptional regulator)
MAEKKVAGVCAGIARYLGVDATLIRVLVAILSVYPPGLGILFYIVCWIVMPRDEQRFLPAATVPNDATNTAS